MAARTSADILPEFAQRPSIFSFIEAFHSPRRRHSALGQMSPADYEEMLVTAQLETMTA